jgi:hypothetical protein
MFGFPELIVFFYLIAIVFWVAGIVVAVRIMTKKAFYILFAVLSLPALMFLNRIVSIFLIKTEIVSTLNSSVIAFTISAVVICSLQILIFFYMKKIKNKAIMAKGDKK